MGESVFEVVKQSVTVREAAELYGIAVGRGGMACCPFHDDRHPSMKVDTRFHCFGCGADGDVIDFTARLYNLAPREAAEKLAQDFGLAYDSQAPPRRRPRILAFPMTTRPRPGEAMSGKNPRRRYGKKIGNTPGAFWRITTTCSENGRPTIPPGRRTRTRTRAFWRLFRKKSTWAICWTLFSTAVPRNRTSGSQNTPLNFRP